MSRFPLRSAYAGPIVVAGAANASFVARARFDGWIVFTSWPRTDAAALLPPELNLAPGAGAPAEHPVAFVLGEQRECAFLVGGFPVATGARYQEFGMMIPFVRHRQGRYLHIYVPRMYASYLPAVWTGNLNFGFGKEPATFAGDGRLLRVARPDGTELLTFDVRSGGPWHPASGCDLENFDAMRAVFELPVLGRREDGSLVSSYFGWDFVEASTRPGQAFVTIHAPLVPDLAPQRCPDVPAGSFEVRGLLWQLSWPTACRF